MKQLLHGIFHAIFWLWNLTFLLVVYAGILPLIGVLLIAATFAGEVPIEFFFSLMGLIAVPTVCTLVGAMRFSKQPVQLMHLFYGVEAPLFLLCLIRLFLLREVNPAGNQIIGTVIVCIAAFLLEMLFGYAGRQRDTTSSQHPVLAWLQMACHSLMLLVGLYVGVLLMFYAIPTAALLIREFFKFEWARVLWSVMTWNPLALLWWLPILFILFAFTCTLFIAMPSALASLYVLSGRQILLAFAAQYGRRAWVGAGAVLTAWMLVFISLQQQPQVRAFSLLKQPALDDSSRQALLAKSEVIRDGLLNSYLSSYRHLSTTKENTHIRAMYGNFLGLPDSAARFLQTSYNQLMSPFLYKGSRSDIEQAEKLYAEFFDAPIQKAERPAIQHALQSTYNRDDAKAGLLNINQEMVWLREQKVTVEARGDWADVELYEVYRNQTIDQQEVFYSFSLPESAVITGLWLGESDDLTKRYPFIVSPRGAAQKIYTQEVQRRVDPALLEQVGPRHYRLRAFPIPPKIASWESTQRQQPEMHLWLTYKVMRHKDGWQLPQLGEKRNVFWTKDTKRIQNGVVSRSQDEWLPPFIKAAGNQPELHEVNLPGGYRISVKPLKEQDYSLPQSQQFAILLDGSRSMGSHVKELTETFKWLQANSFADNDLGNNDADLYVTASVGAKPKRINDIRRFEATKQTFYGTIQLKEMLQQFNQLRGDTSYSGILLVTDEGSYELSDDSKIPTLPAPLWMVHVGGILPPAYDDATLQAIQNSGGGVSTNIPEVLQRLATQAVLGRDAVSVVDGYAWLKSKVEGATAENGFEPLAARQLVNALSKELDATQLGQLDAVHTVAKRFKIVTPYSSMIVLVNDWQKEALKQAEADSDRFDREVEDGQEQLTQPSDPLAVSGVPEPEEWMLICIAAIALLVGWRRRSTVT